MANAFLVSIHNHLSRQIEQSRKAFDQARLDRNESNLSFYEGKLDELMKLRAYLSNSFNLNTQQYY
jgi:hypothetical protein